MSTSSCAAFALKTGTTFVTIFDLDTVAVGVATDSSVWMTDGTILYAYDTGQGEYAQLTNISYNYSLPILSQGLAPVNAQNCYFLGVVNNNVVVQLYTSGKGVSTLPALPEGYAVAITAASDGTLWALGVNGIPYSWSGNSWTAINVNEGMSIAMISVASATFALAIATVNGTTCLMSYSSGTWTAFGSGIPSTVSWVSACPDTSYWYKSGDNFTLVPVGDTVQNFPLTANTYMFGGNVAPTKYGCCYAGFTNPFSLMALSYGALDQPAVAWPTPTSDWTTAYNAVSEVLQISDPNGIRAMYGDLNATPSIWYTEITEMACPQGVSAANWTTVQNQLTSELKYVEGVQKMFSNLGTLNDEVNIEQLYTYNQVVNMVELPDQPAQQPNTVVNIILGAIFSKLFTAALSQAPPNVGQAINLGMSVYNFAANIIAKKHGGTDYNAVLQVACSNLSATLNEVNNQRIQTNSDWQSMILTDWEKLSSCGAAISSGLWYWPTNFDVSVLKGIGNSIQLNFYQTLMPAKWQLMQIQTVLIFMGPPSDPYLTATPPYSFLYQTLEDSQYDVVYWWTVCAVQGSTPSADTTGPFPNQQLLEAIAGITTISDLFMGINGWTLPVVQESGYTAAPSGAPWRGWDDSTAPYTPDSMRAQTQNQVTQAPDFPGVKE